MRVSRNVLLSLGLAILFSSTALADLRDDARKAIDFDQADTLQELFAKGLSPDARLDDSIYGESGIPLIVYAARSAQLRSLMTLIDAKADVNQKNSLNESALMMAAFFPDEGGNGEYTQHEQAVKMLVETGADLKNPNFFTPLGYASFYDHVRIVEYLLEKGAHPDDEATEERAVDYLTPLLFCALNGSKGSLRALLRSGANARIKSSRGENALELARRKGHKNLFVYLECALELKSGESYADKCEKNLDLN